jgi:hypothetical protein
MAGSRKKEMQLRWDALCLVHDKRGFTDHALIARFLSDEVNQDWPSLILTSLQVAYKLLGLHRPEPQGKLGYITAIRTRISALVNSDDHKDGEDVPRLADGAREEQSQRQVGDGARPSGQMAEGARSQRQTATVAPSDANVLVNADQMEAVVAKFFKSLVAQQVTKTSQPESASREPTTTSTSSSNGSKQKSHHAKRDTISIDDENSDEDAAVDLEDKAASKDVSRKYVDNSLQSLKARGCTLSQHVADYALNVGWNSKRNRHEAVEVARLFDAVATETPTEIRRRLMARYVSLEEFDATGSAEVFEHVQAIGHSILASNVKQYLRRNMKRSAINTLDDDAPMSPKRPRKRQRHNNNNAHNNNNHNNNSNNNNNNNQNNNNQNHGGGGYGRGGRGNFQKNKPFGNGQAAVKQDSAGQQ